MSIVEKKLSARLAATTLKVNDDHQSNRRKVLIKTCFKIWNKTTHGRVSPAKARIYHRRKTLRLCMTKWKNSHLPSRVEWKMQIRAEYHDRFRLWQKCIGAWKNFIILNKKNKERKSIADQHANSDLLKRCLSSMKAFVPIEKMKKSESQKTIHHYNTGLERRMWNKWIFVYNNQFILKDMDYFALQHWARTIMFKMFLKWQNAYFECYENKKQIVYSDIFYHSTIVKRALSGWKLYVELRREKKSEKAEADQRYKNHLVRRLFDKWKKNRHIVMLVRESEMKIIKMGERSVKRRYFLRLLLYHQQKCIYQQLHIKAGEWHERNIKVSYFRKLKLATKLEIEKKKNKQEAEKFYFTKLQLKYFINWVMKCDHREDVKLIPLTRIAYRYCRVKQLTMVIYQWKQFVREEQRKKRLWSLAEMHHNTKILPKCFTSWKLFREDRQEIALLKEAAMGFNRELMYSKYFYTWVKEYQISLHAASMDGMAASHHKSNLVKLCFAFWRKQRNRQLAKKNLQVKCHQFHSNRLLLSALSQWRTVYQEYNSSIDKMIKADRFYSQKIRIKSWMALLEYYQGKKKMYLKKMSADRFYTKKLTGIVIESFKTFIQERRVVKKRVNCFFVEKDEILCRWVFESWKAFTDEEKKKKKDSGRAETHFIHSIKHRAFIALINYSTRRIEKRFNEDEAVIRAQIRLDKSFLRKVFIRWKEDAKELNELKDKMAIAHLHCNEVLKNKGLNTWKQYVCHTLRIKVFRSRAMLFSMKMIEASHFQKWKMKHEQVKTEQQKSNIAIWWWSYQLQKKVLRGLVAYRSSQHEKKLEYTSALVFRKNVMLEKGVVNWIKYASKSIDRRREIAYKEQTKKSMELQARVHKYALHWLRKTRTGKVLKDYPYSSSIKYVQPTREVLQTVTPCISLPLTRCKAFDLKYPQVKPRPPPRLPDYLRESFELTIFQNVIPSNGNGAGRAVRQNHGFDNLGKEILPETYSRSVTNLASNKKTESDFKQTEQERKFNFISSDDELPSINCSREFLSERTFSNIRDTENIEEIGLSSKPNNPRRNFTFNDEQSPRYPNTVDMYSPDVHPAARTYSESMRCLELTDDVHLERSVPTENETLLLPPSSFTKVRESS